MRNNQAFSTLKLTKVGKLRNFFQNLQLLSFININAISRHTFLDTRNLNNNYIRKFIKIKQFNLLYTSHVEQTWDQCCLSAKVDWN